MKIGMVVKKEDEDWNGGGKGGMKIGMVVEKEG